MVTFQVGEGQSRGNRRDCLLLDGILFVTDAARRVADATADVEKDANLEDETSGGHEAVEG